MRRAVWRWWGAGMAAVALLVGLACSSNSENAAPAQRKADLAVDATFVAALNDFGFRAFTDTTLVQGEKNTIISPPSLELALAMTYNGADGNTRTAMAKALGYGDLTLEQVNAGNAQLLALLRNPDTNVKLAIANGIWYRPDVQLKADFLERNRTTYTAKTTAIDFTKAESADTINGWVHGNTQGKIPKLVEAEAIKDAYALLVNALYFKGAWTEKFDKAATAEGPFHLLDGAELPVPLMARTGKYRYTATEAEQIIELPYGEKFVSAYVILPKPNAGNFGEFHARLTSENWAKWLAALEEQEVALTLPRVTATYDGKLRPTLQALGMGVAFSDQADFGGMFGATPPQGTPAISEVIHKTTLDINEEGTEASAATGVIIAPTSAPPQVTMTVNRPFIFVIRDNPTGVILFIGSIVRPK